MEQKIQEFFERVKNAKSIAIMGHKNPDGDSLCSVLALAHLIEDNFGVSPVCTYDGNIPDALDYVPLRSRIKYFERVDTAVQYDLAIVMDYGNPAHIGGPRPIVDNAKYVIEIDHHRNENNDIKILKIKDKPSVFFNPTFIRSIFSSEREVFDIKILLNSLVFDSRASIIAFLPLSFLATGFKPTHIDWHWCHTPVQLQVGMELAVKYNIPLRAHTKEIEAMFTKNDVKYVANHYNEFYKKRIVFYYPYFTSTIFHCSFSFSKRKFE